MILAKQYLFFSLFLIEYMFYFSEGTIVEKIPSNLFSFFGKIS